MVDRAALGQAGAPFEMDVERGKIHEFARATRSGIGEGPMMSARAALTRSSATRQLASRIRIRKLQF